MDNWKNNNNNKGSQTSNSHGSGNAHNSGNSYSGYSPPTTPPTLPVPTPTPSRVRQYEDAGGFGIVCGVITYLFGIVGLIIMLCSAQFIFVLPGIIAALALIAPIFVRLARGATVGQALSVCIQYGHYMFTLLVAMWWLLYSAYAVKPGVLIAIGIMTMYAMYYFPCFLALDASSRGLPGGRCVRAAIVCFVDSLLFYVIFAYLAGDAMGDFMNVIFSTSIVVSGNLQHAINKYKEAKGKGNGLRGLISVVLVFAIVLGFSGTVFLVMPKVAERRYEQALTLIEKGEYRAAREALSKNINYPDAAEKLKEIAFVDLQLGETVTIGHHLKHKDKPGRYYALTWTVLEVKDGKALLLCDEILRFQPSNPLYKWNSGNNVRSCLQGVYDAFDDADKERILLSKISTETEAGKFTSEDHLFLLSREELERYCTDDKMLFTPKTGSYYDSQEPPYNVVLCYYTRTSDKNNDWVAVNCDEREFFVMTDDAYIYTGIRPAMYVSIAKSLEAPTE